MLKLVRFPARWSRVDARSRPGSGSLLIMAMVAYLLVYAAGVAVPEAHRYLGGLGYHIPPLVAIALTPPVIRRTAGAERAGWICVLVLLLSWDAAEWVYSYYSLVLDTEAPIPTLADAFYYAGYLAFVCALPLLARSGRGLHGHRSMVDAAILVVVGGTLCWWFFVAPQLPSSGASIGDYVLLGYPVLDLGLLAALVVAFYGRWRNYHPHIRLLLCSVATLVVSDFAYIVLGDDTVAQASPLDLGWLAGYWFIALALHSRARQPAALARPTEGRQSTLSLFLPYLTLIPLLATMASTGSFTQTAAELRAGAMLAVGLIMLRQWLTLFENQRLYASLEAEAAELERLRKDAAYQAEHDELTGLLNRRAWFAAAESRERGAIAIFDIDNFKSINDRFGHPVGDAVLQAIACRLRELVPADVPLGRIGGEEFAAAFADGEQAALDQCRTVLESIATSPIWYGSTALTITLSAGVTAWSTGTDRAASLQTTYEVADRTLYEAKRQGRNRATTPRLAA